LIEQDGRYWVTETQKTVARIHEIDAKLLAGLWAQVDNTLPKQPISCGCFADISGEKLRSDQLKLSAPLPSAQSSGFTVELSLTIDQFTPGQVLLDNRKENGAGWYLSVGPQGSLSISLNDGEHHSTWDSDPGCFKSGRRHHVAFVVDRGPRIITVIVDGVLCDGGTTRQFGWSRFAAEMGDFSGAKYLQLDPEHVTLHRLRLYDRYLRTAEVVQNYVAESLRDSGGQSSR
jgi:hypothetical protein